EEDIRLKLLSELPGETIARKFIDRLDSDDAADIINDLHPRLKEEVITNITDQIHARAIIGLLYYEDDVAGGLMAKELVKANISWTVDQCILEVKKQAEGISHFYAIYVVDGEDVLHGVVSLKKLLITDGAMKLQDIYDEEVVSVTTLTSSDEVEKVINKYDFVSLPVIDTLGKLVGRITIDDVVDVMKEEAEKDLQQMSGISENVDVGDKVWILSRARLPWLLIGLLGGILSAKVIGAYEDDLKIYPEMAFFIPLIAAMSGNAGIQSATIVVQSLANKTLVFNSIFDKIFKELKVGLLNGVICSAILFLFNVLFSDSIDLGITVSTALFVVIIFATVLGSMVPLMLDKFKIDPGLATGPFVTTVNDVIAIAVYFSMGRLLYIV
ncbi:magnesium transporter, partial [bacterium AH-315-C07]|nr:magnesium transporter [bacterium AH-315-C07]